MNFNWRFKDNGLSKGINGYFDSNQSVESMVKENLNNVLLTRKGERKMYKDLGTNIYNYLFEQKSVEMKINIKKEIFDCAKKYVPFCEIDSINILFSEDILPISKYASLNIDQNFIFVEIFYSVISQNGNIKIPGQNLVLLIKNQ